jgi:hypothetical protein
MARRKKSSPQPVWIALVAALVVVAFLGSRFFLAPGPEAKSSVAELDVPAYMENANSLRGNVFQATGIVADALAWSPASGRLIAVEIADETIPILVTADFKATNIQKGQKLHFVVEVDENGILKTRKVTQP